MIGRWRSARSLACEQNGALAEALAVLTRFTDTAEEVDEIEDLLADGVRLAMKVGDMVGARRLADRAVTLAHGCRGPESNSRAPVNA